MFQSKNLSYLFFIIFWISCDSQVNQNILPNNTGKTNEIIVVVDDYFWEKSQGNIIRDIFSKEIPGLPQSEEFFNLIQINHKEFGRFFRTHQNIIFVNKDAKDSYSKNKWATNQTIIYLNLNQKNTDFKESCVKAFNFINNKEIYTIKNQYKNGHNKSATKHIKQHFDIDIYVPTEYNTSKKEDNLFIADFHSFNEKQDLLKYIIVFQYAKHTNNEDDEEMILKTDSILRQYIQGSVKGSFVQIDKRVQLLKDGDTYRGMWMLKNGFMAGPVVLKKYLKEDRVVISLGLVFHPNEAKRKFVRDFESIL